MHFKDHSESVLAAKESLDYSEQERNLQESIKEAERHQIHNEGQAKAILKKSLKAHQSLEDIEQVNEQKEFIDNQYLQQRQSHAQDLINKTDLAEIKRANSFTYF